VFGLLEVQEGLWGDGTREATYCVGIVGPSEFNFFVQFNFSVHQFEL